MPPACLQRSGSVLVAVIVGLMVVLLLGTAIVRHLVFHQRQMRAQQQRLQAFWIAESALDRAAAELRSDPQYSGTQWHIEISGPAGPQTGVAEIRVEADDSSPDQRQVYIVARWPDDPLQQSVHRKESVIQLAGPGDSQ